MGRDGWLLDAAQARRRLEQMQHPDVEYAQEEISGRPHCSDCGEPITYKAVGTRCLACRTVKPKPRVCGVSGCGLPARANGRCRRHVHGDDEWWGWPARPMKRGRR